MPIWVKWSFNYRARLIVVGRLIELKTQSEMVKLFCFSSVTFFIGSVSIAPYSDQPSCAWLVSHVHD